MPGFAFHTDAERCRAVHVGEGPALVLAIAPAEAGENPHVADNLLLNVQAEAVLAAIGASSFDVSGTSRVFNRRLVTAHVRPVQISEQPHRARAIFYGK